MSKKQITESQVALSKVEVGKRIISNINAKNLPKIAKIAEKQVVVHAKRHIGSRLDNIVQVRRAVLVWVAIVVALLGSVVIFRAQKSDFIQDGFVAGGTYTEGAIGGFSSLNPLFASSNPERIFAEVAFLKPLDIDSAGKINYEAVEKISTSDDYKTFTATLSDGLQWSDGEKLTTDDVIFTINILKNKALFPQKAVAWENVEVSKLDDVDIKFTMPTATPLTLYSLDFPILPKHKFEDVSIENLRDSDFENNPITSGAFSYKGIFRSTEKTTIRLEKNEKYYAGAPLLDYFEISGFAKKEDLAAALVDGRVSGVADVSGGDFSEAQLSNLEKNQSQLNRGVFAFLNTKSDFLKEKKLRNALAKVVDFEGVVGEIEDVSKMDYPVFEEYFDAKNVESWQKDVAAAEKLIGELGWKKSGDVWQKDGKNLKLRLFSTNDEILEKLANSLKSQLENFGVQVELTVVDKNDKTGAYLQSVIQPREFDVLLYEIDLGADMDVYPFWHSSQATDEGLNFSGYGDFAADNLLLNYREAKDGASQKAAMTKFVEQWLKDTPALPVARAVSNYYYRNGVRAYSAENRLTSGFNRYSDVENWAINKSALYNSR